MAAGNYVLDDVDKEEINVTVVDPNYGSQLLEFIIDDDKNEAADVETEGDWSDVKPEEYVKIETDLPGEKRAGISGGGGSPCLQPGATTPVNANETATPATDTGGGGAGGTPKQDESALIGKDAKPNLDASGQGGRAEIPQGTFINEKTKLDWYIGPIKKKTVKVPGVDAGFTVAIEAWAIFTNLVYDIHNEVEDFNLFTSTTNKKGKTIIGQNEGSLCVRAIRGAEKGFSANGKWSNHSTGTAIDMNTHLHPNHVSNTFSPAQYATLRAIMDRYKNVVKGGFTYGSPDDMHFEINVKPAALAKVTKEMGLEARAASIAAGTLKTKVWPASKSGQKSW